MTSGTSTALFRELKGAHLPWAHGWRADLNQPFAARTPRLSAQRSAQVHPRPPAHPVSLGSAMAQSAWVLFKQARIQRGGTLSLSFMGASNQKHLEIHRTKLEASGQSSSTGIHGWSWSLLPPPQHPPLRHGLPPACPPFTLRPLLLSLPPLHVLLPVYPPSFLLHTHFIELPVPSTWKAPSPDLTGTRWWLFCREKVESTCSPSQWLSPWKQEAQTPHV